MALPVTVILEPSPEGGFKFHYTSSDPGVVTEVDGIAHINVPHNPVVGQPQDVSFTLESNVPNATAAFITDPVVWVDAGTQQPTPSGMTMGSLGSTQLGITVVNDNSGTDPIKHAFFLVVLVTGPGGMTRIFGADPILVEEPPPG